MRYCQGTSCHQYFTKDRLKGQKDKKTYQTRRRSKFYYGHGNFCSFRCQDDWFHDFGNKAIDHFGRITEPKHLTQYNAWIKTYSWDNSYNNRTFIFRNEITKEERPITEQQYDDEDYTLNTI